MNNTSTISNRINYNGIDIMKLVCAILVVFLHTYCYDFGKAGILLKEGITYVAVPFFFIASGFFLNAGIDRCNTQDEKKNYILKYEKRVILMYLIWTLITLPVSIMNINITRCDESIAFRILCFIRSLFFSGSLGVYWYILSLIYNSVIIYFSKLKKLLYALFLVSLVFFIYGILYNGGIIPENSVFYKVIHIPFGSTRNFLTVGLFYMCVGVLINIKSNAISNFFNTLPSKIVLFVAFVCVTVLRFLEVQYLDIHFLESIQAILLFLIALNIKASKIDKKALYLRKASTAIYLIHFPFILVFDYYLKRGTIVDFILTCIFCVALWLLCMRFLPKRAYSIIFG